MRCRQCDYSLWNLTSPQCPECGLAFDWRTYRFKRGSVALACLHCGQTQKYAAQLIQKEQFTCPGCGRTCKSSEVRVIPLTPDPRQAEAVPEFQEIPFKVGLPGWRLLLGLFVFELPGNLIWTLPFVGTSSALNVVRSSGIFAGLALPAFLPMFVSLALLRSLCKPKWTMVEIIIGYILALTALLITALFLLWFNFAALATGGIAAALATVLVDTPFVGIILLTLLNWKLRLPHVIFVQTSLRVAFLPYAIAASVIFAFADIDKRIGYWVMVYTMLVYIAAICTLNFMCWERMEAFRGLGAKPAPPAN